jgi:hypothetical protein
MDPWKPDKSASASAAAVLAKDYKMAPARGPSESSTAGSKAAALAAGSAQRQHQRKSNPPSLWGNSAANMAFKASNSAANSVYHQSAGPGHRASHLREGSSISGITTPPGNASALARQGSLYAAKGAMAGLRGRSKSSPQIIQTYPDQANAASNALNAATIAHRPHTRVTGIPPEEAGSMPYTTMGREMFTSHPPVKTEADDQKRADVLHASAVAMAKRMYNQQQKMIESTKRAHARSSSFTRHESGSPHESEDEVIVPVRFNNLQEAAFKLAQERLAKLHQEHQKNREFQEYYSSPAILTRRNKLGTIRGKLTRRHSASDSELMEDKKESQRIRQQMSLFNTNLTEVNEQKRARDRQAVLAAAQRNVKAQLQGMDKKMSEETGRVAPSTMGAWEHKAHVAAQLRVASFHNPNAGKIDIGGGKFIDKEAVDEIAAKRVQPLLDEINDKAEIERERQAALKLDEQRRKEEAEKRKSRDREVQEIYKKLKGEIAIEYRDISTCTATTNWCLLEKEKEKDRIRRNSLRQDERSRKQKTKTTTTDPVRPSEANGLEVFEPITKSLTSAFPKLRTKFKDREKEKEKGTPDSPISAVERSPTSGKATSPHMKVKAWIMNRIGRPRSKSSITALGQSSTQKQGFVGGAALNRIKKRNVSTPSVNNRSSSLREVATARTQRPLSEQPWRNSRGLAWNATGNDDQVNDADDSDSEPSIVPSLGSLSTNDRFFETRSQLDGLLPPSTTLRSVEVGRGSPAKESRFIEMME